MALFQYNNGKFIVAVSVLGAQLGLNLSTLLSPEGFCDLQLHNIALEAVAWPSWNTLLLMLAIDAHGVCLKHQSGRAWLSKRRAHHFPLAERHSLAHSVQ